MSEWTKWTKCTLRCGGGVHTHTRKVTKEPNYYGKQCPKLTETKPCNTGMCIGTGAPRVCGATTPAPKKLARTLWKLYGNDGLYVDIDTSHCKFDSPPQYLTSMTGSAKHWSLTGSASVSRVTKTSFRVIVVHPTLSGMKLLLAAKHYAWRVGWVGNTGNNGGNTNPGQTGWQVTKHGSLFLKVNNRSKSK